VVLKCGTWLLPIMPYPRFGRVAIEEVACLRAGRSKGGPDSPLPVARVATPAHPIAAAPR
jgi:hypothetical protein